MSTIRTMEARMPPGFRFHPRDSELVLDYLLQKLSGHHHHHSGSGVAMVDVDLNKCEPWELPEESCVGGKRNEWYFFSQRGRKYATGDRTDRATRSGYWKATGKDRAVVAAAAKAAVVGMRKTLVFYRGRAPRGRKTEWVMHEFRLYLPQTTQLLLTPKEDWVLCRVFLKSKSRATTRTTTTTTAPAPARPPPSGVAGYQQAWCMPSHCEPDQLPAVATYDDGAFDSSRIIMAGQQVPCFSGGSPATTGTFSWGQPVGSLLGDLIVATDDTSEKQDEEAMRVMVGSMMTTRSTVVSSRPELAPSWEEQENDQAHIWNLMY